MSVPVCMCEKENTREKEQEVFCVDNPRLETVPHNQKEKKRKEEIRIVISMKQKLDHKEKRFRFRCVIKNMFKACTHTQSTRTHTIHLNTPPILQQGLLGQDGESTAAASSPFCDMEEAEVRQWVWDPLRRGTGLRLQGVGAKAIAAAEEKGRGESSW